MFVFHQHVKKDKLKWDRSFVFHMSKNMNNLVLTTHGKSKKLKPIVSIITHYV